MLYRCANSLVDNAVCKSIVMLDIIGSSGGICRKLSARVSCRPITARIIRILYPDHHLSTQSIACGSSPLAATLWS